MDAIKLLKDDHERIKKLLSQGEDTTERARVTRGQILEKITEELKVHELREEQIFYPALQERAEAREIVLEGFEEHHVVDGILGELTGTDVTDEHWAAKFKVLKENIEHHIEEEEGEMFSKARQLLDRDQLNELGDRMAEIKSSGGRSD